MEENSRSESRCSVAGTSRNRAFTSNHFVRRDVCLQGGICIWSRDVPCASAMCIWSPEDAHAQDKLTTSAKKCCMDAG